MKTLKVMAIIGIILFGLSFLYRITDTSLSGQGVGGAAYALAFSIVVLVQSKRHLKR